MNSRVTAVLVGKIAPLGPERVPSAFVKEPVAGAVQVVRDWLDKHWRSALAGFEKLADEDLEKKRE